MTELYAIGIDFGTLSGRAVLVDAKTGEVAAQAVKDYAHGVMETALPDGTKLPADWALQHPGDYLEVLYEVIPAVMRMSGASPEQVIGIGVDFTSSTVLPVDQEGHPLCLNPEFVGEPNAWVKLWKHHGAQDQARRLTQVAAERGETFLTYCGGIINSELMIPKLLETLELAPEVYEQTECFMEAGDWIVRNLIGENIRSAATAGYKALWSKCDGPLSSEYLKAVNPKFEHLITEKLGGKLVQQGEAAGRLTKAAAERLGLRAGIPVTDGHLDGHVAGLAVGIDGPEKLLLVLGTSAGAMICSEKKVAVPGSFGMVEDGLIPGYYCYEAGQSCVGDMFNWFVKNSVPAAYAEEAREKEVTVHQLLTEKASKLKIGESGLIALDWWNGNRSCLVDAELTGMFLGMTLSTKPEEMYRALLEASVFGMRKIIDNFEENGIGIRQIYACGGISRKNPLMMQIYADVTNREVFIGASDQCPALGSAIFGMVAAGASGGGYDTVAEAAAKLGRVAAVSYKPIPENVVRYEALYQEFLLLHDYFGTGGNDVMKRLRRIRTAGKGTDNE
ncbi:MAG: ribulokinase [Lachnospiraceae bacterium]|nr:ribulokinase [Lachnospiraceae bacterium]